MDLETLIKIKESGSTLTRDESRPSEPGSTYPSGDIEYHFPPPDELADGGKAPDIPVPEIPPRHLLLNVVMTFLGDMPRLRAREIGVVAEGGSIEEAFRRLIEATREQLTSSEGARGELLGYAPHTWFRFVAPDQTAYADKATLTDGFIGVLKELYEFKGHLVESFLKENPSLTSLLFAAYGAVHDYFGSGVKTALEVVADPEALGDRQLFVLIGSELPRKEARVHLAELDRGWWLGVLPTADGKMEIALE